MRREAESPQKSGHMPAEIRASPVRSGRILKKILRGEAVKIASRKLRQVGQVFWYEKEKILGKGGKAQVEENNKKKNKYKVRVSFWVNVEADNEESAKNFAEWAAYSRIGIKPESVEVKEVRVQ